MVERFTLTVDGIAYPISMEGNDIWVDGARYSIRKEGSTININEGGYEVDIHGDTATVNGDSYHIRVDLDLSTSLPAAPEASVEATEESSDGHIKAIMPGRVIAVRVQEGDRVERGAVILVLEAMKMENELKARISGIVKEIRAFVGKNVEVNETLAVIE